MLAMEAPATPSAESEQQSKTRAKGKQRRLRGEGGGRSRRVSGQVKKESRPSTTTSASRGNTSADCSQGKPAGSQRLHRKRKRQEVDNVSSFYPVVLSIFFATWGPPAWNGLTPVEEGKHCLLGKHGSKRGVTAPKACHKVAIDLSV